VDTKRVDWVDIAKGFGIVLVVFGHAARGLDSAGITFRGFAQVDKFIYSFHMPLFFALSGFFFIASARKGGREYLRSKVSTILYPYLIWSLIQIVIQYAASSLINGDVTWHDVVTFYEPRGQFWFLLGLFITSITNLLFYSLLKIRGILISSLLSFVIIVLKVDLGVLNLGLNNVLYFNIGIIIADSAALRQRLIQSQSLMFSTMVVFFGIEFVNIAFGLTDLLITITLSILGIVCSIQASAQLFKSSNTLRELGRNSMPIYLMHTIVSSSLRIVLQKVVAIDNIFVHLIVGTAGGLFVPYFMYKYLLAKKFDWLFVLRFPRFADPNRASS
jgi:fucose 4-O-acetylase-like acetyltransferase